MKKTITFFIALLGLTIGVFLAPPKTTAQTCSGSVNDSYTQFSCDIDCSTGPCIEYCNPHTATNSQSCSGSGGPGWDCNYDYVRINDKCDDSGGSCILTSSQPAPIPDAGICPGPPAATPPPPPAGCGDGKLDPGEECDDGNNINGDGCSSSCIIETTGCTGGSICQIPSCPAGMALGSGLCTGGECCDYVTTATPPPPPPPHSCEVNPAGSTFTHGLIVMGTGDTITVQSSIWGTPDGGEVTGYFSQLAAIPPRVISFGPLKRDKIGRKSQMDATFSYTVHAEEPGEADIAVQGNVYLNSCIGNNDLRIVVIPGPWFQVNGDIFSAGNINSSLPASKVLITDSNAGFPGVSIYGPGSTLNTGSGSISSTNWSAETDVNTTPPITYDYLKGLVNPTTLSNSSSNTVNNVVSGGYVNPSDSTVWINHTGDWDINSSLILPDGRKTVVFVDGAVNINANIRLVNPKTSLFMLVATGNITVGDAVSNINIGSTDHALEGLFYTDGTFQTLGGTQLSVYGSVYAGNFDLQRNLGIQNASLPSEIFVLNPALLLNFPADISPKKVVWKEVLP